MKAEFIDLFAGIGGLRLGFEQGFKQEKISAECVLTSEIKRSAITVLEKNFSHKRLIGDIVGYPIDQFPRNFDFLIAGFPCQPFSSGGKRHGFADTRGTLFFEIERILEAKRPYGFLLENVEGLVKHDLQNKRDEIGQTLATILAKLQALGYFVTWKVLDASDFGLPQSRRRIFIVGTKDTKVSLEGFDVKRVVLKKFLEKGQPTLESEFVKLLLDHFEIEDLHGKAIKDKRGGDDNIHSWDLELKGPVSAVQAELLNRLLKERRKKHWAEQIGIPWMDGMPLTTDQIRTFFDIPNLQSVLDDLTTKGYLRFEHPKNLIVEETELGKRTHRVPASSLRRGYNIVSGKLSFEINKILDPNDIAPTLVATDMERLAVPDGYGLRRMTVREGLNLFGFPDEFKMPVSRSDAFDLLGNTVAINVVRGVSQRLAFAFNRYQKKLIESAKAVPFS